jgi:hypothetical protein
LIELINAQVGNIMCICVDIVCYYCDDRDSEFRLRLLSLYIYFM